MENAPAELSWRRSTDAQDRADAGGAGPRRASDRLAPDRFFAYDKSWTHEYDTARKSIKPDFYRNYRTASGNLINKYNFDFRSNSLPQINLLSIGRGRRRDRKIIHTTIDCRHKHTLVDNETNIFVVENF